jgi:hypothetical protein
MSLVRAGDAEPRIAEAERTRQHIHVHVQVGERFGPHYDAASDVPIRPTSGSSSMIAESGPRFGTVIGCVRVYGRGSGSWRTSRIFRRE